MFLRSKAVQKMGGGFMERFGLGLWSKLQLKALKWRKPEGDVKLLRQVRKERKSLLSTFEAYLILSVARSQLKIPGDYAEVGVFEGASAKLVSEVKGDRKFRLFDTFAGLPQDSEKDGGVHKPGMFACSLESVQKYLAGYQHLSFHKGLFPDSAVGVEEAKYAFAHFDVDLYEGTLGCLQYFYPRMSPGGIMISHDYGLLIGVEKAFQEFMADKPEPIIELPTTQCMVVKQ